MLTTNCSQNWWITLEQQEVRNCQFCILVSSLDWSTVVFHCWPTRGNVRVLRRVFQAMELQACLRVIAQSPSIWDTYGMSGNAYANPTARSSALYPQESDPWVSNVSEHTSPHVMSASQTPAQDPRCQSGPSARKSFDPSEGRFSKGYKADQQRLQISDLHFDKFPAPATFACWKTRFKTEVCTCSQFLTEAMHWIKEVEMVEPVDDLKSSRSIRGTLGPDFELFDAKIVSALNRIIHNTFFKRKVSLEEMKVHKEETVSRKTDCVLDLRVLPGHWSQWFCRESCEPIHSCSSKWIQEFDSKWDGILLSMTKIPFDDIMTMVKKKYRTESAIEEFLRPETEIMKGTPWSRIRDKTAWTKNSERLLAVESQRAVFWRRQLQFPARYE